MIICVSASIAGIYAFKQYRNKRQLNRAKRFSLIKYKKLGGVTLTEAERQFYIAYEKRPAAKPTFWNKQVHPRIVKVVHFPRRLVASIVTQYNPLALRDQVADLTTKLSSAKKNENNQRSLVYGLRRQVEELNELIPEEIKEAEFERRMSEELEAKRKKERNVLQSGVSEFA